MATLQRKNVASPDETRAFPNGTFNIVRLGDVSIASGQFEPGWRWSARKAVRRITWAI